MDQHINTERTLDERLITRAYNQGCNDALTGEPAASACFEYNGPDLEARAQWARAGEAYRTGFAMQRDKLAAAATHLGIVR